MIFAVIIASFLFWFPQPVAAKYDPLGVPNNKFGIHVADTNDISDTAPLVNSSGGDWGYVTLVMQEDDRNHDKWQAVFDRMRRLHLIPIVRLATHIDGDSWAKPYDGSDRDWARFLNSLNWPIENRYVIIFNEPNHANEWGRTIDPEGYARTLLTYAKTLQKTSEDFFILPAGLDVSAASDGRSLDAYQFLVRMIREEPSILSVIDGWTSHSYANPGFSGSPYGQGRGTVRSYMWELNVLAQLGLKQKLPVFITETGWVHSSGVKADFTLLSPESVAEYFRIAASTVWQDPIIASVTPFVFSYQGLPFDHFSWKKLNSGSFYPQYFAYQNIPKNAGKPQQRQRYTFENKFMPDSLVSGSTYELSALLKNEGQGIYNEQSGYTVDLRAVPKYIFVKDPLPPIEPGQFGTLTMHVETPTIPGVYPYAVEVLHNGKSIIIEEGMLTLVPPPSVSLSVQLGWRSVNNAVNATVLIYDHATLIHKVQGVKFEKGKANVEQLHNVVPGEKYRIVVLVPYYLPRQQIVTVTENNTEVSISRMYPLDYNLDGEFSMKDFLSLSKFTPHFIRSLFLGP